MPQESTSTPCAGDNNTLRVDHFAHTPPAPLADAISTGKIPICCADTFSNVVGVIDRNGNGEDHGVRQDVVIREAHEAGFKLIEKYDFVKGDRMDYCLVVTPAE